MPCAMMHLLCARLYDEDAPIAFYIGNEAPDCMDIRELKDVSHLRIYTDNRNEKLIEYAHTLMLCDPYQLGVLLHLYTDMLWDFGPMKKHRESYKGDDWFHDYRRQIRLIGTEMYKRFEWSKQMWSDMAEAPTYLYNTLTSFPSDKIKDYITFNKNRDRSDENGESPDFPHELMVEFCRNTVNSFKDWITKIN